MAAFLHMCASRTRARPRPARGTTALLRTREASSLVRWPSRVGGLISTRATRRTRAESARAASRPHRKRTQWRAHVCAHAQTSRPCARRPRLAMTPLSCTERKSTLLLCGGLLESEDDSIRRCKARGPGKRTCCASSSEKASAVAALLRTCANRSRGAQGQRAAPRPCTERESPVASVAAF